MRTIPFSDPTQAVARFVRGQGIAPSDIFEILQTPFSIGRGDNCDLTLDSAKVSREHAIVRRDANGFYLRDNRSTNGTFVNGEKIAEARLNDGDVVSFAQIELTFSVSGPAEIVQAATQCLSAATETPNDRDDAASVVLAVRTIREATCSAAIRCTFQPIVELATGIQVAIDLSPRHDTLLTIDRWLPTVEARGTALWHDVARTRAVEQAARLWPGHWLVAKVESQEVGRQEVVAALCDLQCRIGGTLAVAIPDGSVADIPYFREFIGALREDGIKIVYDGFARGASQLEALAGVAPDYVRLSPSLARGIDRANDRRSQLAGVVQAAEATQTQVIATGVHHEDEWATCRELGIHFAQGNHFAGCQPLDSHPEFQP